MLDVKLEAYEGPLDLLLTLIRRSEIDIYDIPIAQVTAEYLDVISNFPPNMSEMSEFLVMAATLLEIKSKMLLPRPKMEGESPEEDPRDALARQLLAYQQAQTIAEQLQNLTPIGERLLGAGDKALLKIFHESQNNQPIVDLISLSHLAEIFADVMNRQEDKIDKVRAGYGEMPREVFTVANKVEYITKLLNTVGHLSLKSLFYECRTRREMVVTFLAMLELVRRGKIHTNQQTPFEDVEVRPCLA
ncbi:MAG: segregation/condensation protein A [Defluviitaleaceae bacterium]|nr:segregation/condensation protein A [Defluviitaleaceae bacterium]